MNDTTHPDFTIQRLVDAPRALVWEVYTQPAHLMKWFGPKGFAMLRCEMDLRPGGRFHYCLRSPEGLELWGKWIIQDIVVPETLSMIIAFSDAAGGTTRHPMNPNWPRETLATTTFTERDGKTLIDLRWSAHHATDIEQKTFDESHASMQQGWGGTFEQLVAYLEALQS